MPGHSGGFCHGLASAGIKCCTNGGMGVPQIEDDPAGVSAGLVKRLLKEMAGLFPDSVMHIGDRSPHGFCPLLASLSSGGVDRRRRDGLDGAVHAGGHKVVGGEDDRVRAGHAR